MQDYLSLVKQHVKEDYAVIVIDNSDIAKPKSRKMEALSEIRDGSTGKITKGYLTIKASVLSSAHTESIFLRKLEECSRRIYGIPKFIFYALGYAIERVLSMSRKGINSFFPKKAKSQQLNLFEHLKIEDTGAFAF